MRLFLALDVDEGVRTAAAAWMSELKRHLDVHASGLRFARLDALHITLHFLGDVSAAGVDGLRQALAERLPIPAFDATLADAAPRAGRRAATTRAMDHRSRHALRERSVGESGAVRDSGVDTARLRKRGRESFLEIMRKDSRPLFHTSRRPSRRQPPARTRAMAAG
jgi:LigT like Phosphoesterase